MTAVWNPLLLTCNVLKALQGKPHTYISMCGNCGEIANFPTCGEISEKLMGFYCNLCRFVAKSVICAVLSRILATIYALSCGAKLSPKGEKMTFMRSGHTDMNHFLNGVQNLDSSQSNKNCELETHVEFGFRRRM